MDLGWVGVAPFDDAHCVVSWETPEGEEQFYFAPARMTEDAEAFAAPYLEMIDQWNAFPAVDEASLGYSLVGPQAPYDMDMGKRVLALPYQTQGQEPSGEDWKQTYFILTFDGEDNFLEADVTPIPAYLPDTEGGYVKNLPIGAYSRNECLGFAFEAEDGRQSFYRTDRYTPEDFYPEMTEEEFDEFFGEYALRNLADD